MKYLFSILLIISFATSAQIRINAGGPSVLFGPDTWSADANFSSGTNVFSAINPISGTDNDRIYQTERWGNAFNYSIPVANGQFDVHLHFAEIFLDLPGQRVFNVNIENDRVLNNFDILSQVAKNTALVRSFRINVSDGNLNINFTSMVNNAKISAIEIVPIPPVTITPPDRTDTTRFRDTVRIAYYYPSIDTFSAIYEINMPSFYGGRVLLKDSTTLYKAIFGVLPPLKTDTELTPRVYRFNYSGFRITLFRTGAWIRQRLINGVWTEVPY